MAESAREPQPTPFRRRVDRHRVAPQDPTPPPASAGRDSAGSPPPAPARQRVPPAASAGFAPPRDHTPSAVRRPAQVSERCTACGASTRGRSGMATELVEVAGVRVLRVVACSACPDRRRLATGIS